MKRVWGGALLSLLIAIPAWATPLYVGLLLDDSSVGGILGFQVNARYAAELHAAKSSSTISHANVSVVTDTTKVGIDGIARFPMKLNEVLPYSLLVKLGWARTTDNAIYTIPNSVSLLDSGRVTNRKNQFKFGGAAEYEFKNKFVGRVGLDFLGKDKSIYLAALYKF
ncbi:MAG: hypothetical protein ABL911_05405 [Gallionella sp.]|nr:hypothetical protein [Gallionella sp.]